MEKVNKGETSNATEIMKAANSTASVEISLIDFAEELFLEEEFEDSDSTELGNFIFEL